MDLENSRRMMMMMMMMMMRMMMMMMMMMMMTLTRILSLIALAPDAVPPLMQAQNEVANTSVFLSTLEAQLIEMGLLIETLLNKTAFIKESSQDGITMVNAAFSNGTCLAAASKVNYIF